MSIKVHRNDFTFEVATEADLRMVLKVLGEMQLTMPLTVQPLAGSGAPFPDTSKDTGLSAIERLVRFIKAIKKPSQRLLLESLAANASGLSDAQLRQILGFTTNTQLAGVLAALYKNGKREGLTKNQIMSKQKSGTPKQRVYHYTLTRPMREAFDTIPQPSDRKRSPEMPS